MQAITVCHFFTTSLYRIFLESGDPRPRKSLNQTTVNDQNVAILSQLMGSLQTKHILIDIHASMPD